MRGLIPDVITHTMTFLGICDRVTCRLVSREFQNCTPSPWRLAGDVLEGANAFDVSPCCNAKLSFAASPERPLDDAFNEARAIAISCLSGSDPEYNCEGKKWLWAGDAEEAANTDVEHTFARRDPRRKPAYKSLMDRVSKRSYALLDNWIKTGPFAPPDIRSPEAERLRQLMDFSKAAKERLAQYHEVLMYRALARMPQSVFRWSLPYAHGSPPSPAYVAAFGAGPCAYDFIHDLGSLNVATTELFQMKSPDFSMLPVDPRRTLWECEAIYHFGSDCLRDGHIEVVAGMGSSYSIAVSAHVRGLFEIDGDNGGDGYFVGTKVKPYSKRHFKHLLESPYTLFQLHDVFGEIVCDDFFDPLSRTRNHAEEIWRQIVAIDAELDAEAEAEVEARLLPPPRE